jgi:superfamily II DNA helicase RecQ
VKNIPGKITLIQLVDAFRGSASKKSRQYEHLRQYGAGRSLSRGDAERLGQSLVTQRILEEYCEANGLGFVSSYVRPGRDEHLLVNGTKRITMAVSDDPKKVRKPSAVPPKSLKATMSKRKDQGNRLEVADEDYYDEFIVDDDWDDGPDNLGRHEKQHEDSCASDHYDETNCHGPDDDLVVDELGSIQDFLDDRPEELLTEVLTPSDDPTSLEDSPTLAQQTECYNELIALRGQICIQENTSTRFLPNSVIQALAADPPGDLASLFKVVGTSPIMERKASALLGVTRRYRRIISV